MYSDFTLEQDKYGCSHLNVSTYGVVYNSSTIRRPHYKLYTHPSRGTPLTATESASDKLAPRRSGIGSIQTTATCKVFIMGWHRHTCTKPGNTWTQHCRSPAAPQASAATTYQSIDGLGSAHSDLPFPWQDRQLRALNAKSSTVAGIRALRRSVATGVVYV